MSCANPVNQVPRSRDSIREKYQPDREFKSLKRYNLDTKKEQIDIPLLSICCATYNHEEYIINSLNSLLSQKVDFKYEVIIGEDCSTDSSRELLKGIISNNPNIFEPIYWDLNVGFIKNFREIFRRAKGKYIICLETDDYWIDSTKLQTQVDILEHDLSLIAVAHDCLVVDNSNNPNGEVFPSKKSGYYTLKDYRNSIMPGQSTTVMFRNIFKMEDCDTSLVDNIYDTWGPIDRRIFFTLAAYGKILCIPERMSAYRHVTSTGSSFSATNKFSLSNNLAYYKNYLQYVHQNAFCKEIVYTAEAVFFKALIMAYIHKDYKTSIAAVFKDWKDLRYRMKCTGFVFNYYVKKVFKGLKQYKNFG